MDTDMGPALAPSDPEAAAPTAEAAGVAEPAIALLVAEVRLRLRRDDILRH